MLPREWTVRITDMLDAIAKIERYTDGMSYEQFEADERTIDAVIRNLGIIGEAARHVPFEITQTYPDIAWAEMIGMRNFVIHQYGVVNLATIWQTVREDLPTLTPLLEAMLRDQQEPE